MSAQPPAQPAEQALEPRAPALVLQFVAGAVGQVRVMCRRVDQPGFELEQICVAVEIHRSAHLARPQRPESVAQLGGQCLPGKLERHSLARVGLVGQHGLDERHPAPLDARGRQGRVFRGRESEGSQPHSFSRCEAFASGSKLPRKHIKCFLNFYWI